MMLTHHKGLILASTTGTVVTGVLILLMHLNYFLSYGPLTNGQLRGYQLAFAGNAIVIITSIIASIITVCTRHSEFLPFLYNMGYSLGAAILLGSFVVFLTDPPDEKDMIVHLLDTFAQTHKATPLLEKLQHHKTGENHTLECCGIESYLDYVIYPRIEDQEPILSHVSVPDSCCIKVTPGCGRDIPHTLADRPLNETIYVKGCLPGGIDRFLGRLDCLTHFGYKSVSYSVMFLFALVLLGVAIFNVLHLSHTKALMYDEPEESKSTNSMLHGNPAQAKTAKEQPPIGSEGEILARTTATTDSL